MWADDTQASIAEALSRALTHADLVLTTGGVSVGSYDLVPAALRELGGETLFHGVALKPGNPILVARVGGRWLVGLPGNPLAVLVGWRVFAWPLARALAGDLHAFAETPISAHLGEVPAADGRTELALPCSTATARQVHVLPWKVPDVAAAAPASPGAARPAAALTVSAAVPTIR
jgi:molybdopterin molybdotransferase